MTDQAPDVRSFPGERRSAVMHVDSPGTATAARVDAELDLGYRAELRLAEKIVNPETWAGGIEDKRAIAPRLRVGRDRWLNLLWLIPIGFALLVAAVAVGKGLHNMPAVQAFIQRYPGTDVPSGVGRAFPRGWAGRTSSTCS
ncbi:hypothetical protein LAUMK41_00513 [Mycobacterium attenuatum]|nr:hypothetical protein LAUMK41_00513 [Mycobacterium attenuatum]